jgi:hypothetical protein
MISFCRNIILSLLLIVPFFSLSQEESIDDRWKQMEERINYGPSGNKQGPSNNYSYPPTLQSKTSKGTSGGTISNSPSNDEIKYSREQLYDNSTGGGVKQRIKDPNRSNLDDVDSPDTEAPDVDLPDWDAPDFSESDGTFWKVLLIIIGIALVAFILYHLFFKQTEKTEDKIAPVDYSSNDIDPRQIEKYQLELDLEDVIQKEDHRTAIRIYYTMILKALIEKDWIIWEKKKTNINYLLEMQKRSEKHEFETSIRIFEWVWYGKHQPKPNEFKQVQHFFESFYKKIKGE